MCKAKQSEMAEAGSEPRASGCQGLTLPRRQAWSLTALGPSIPMVHISASVLGSPCAVSLCEGALGGPSWAGAQSLLCVPLGVTSPFWVSPIYDFRALAWRTQPLASLQGCFPRLQEAARQVVCSS